MLIRNETRSTELACAAVVADTGPTRRVGLLKRTSLPKGEGLWIVPCESVHTFFMKFSIDLVYLDKKLRVKKVVRSLRPWRLSACLSAHSVIELPAGVVGETGTRAGDQIGMDPSA